MYGFSLCEGIWNLHFSNPVVYLGFWLGGLHLLIVSAVNNVCTVDPTGGLPSPDLLGYM